MIKSDIIRKVKAHLLACASANVTSPTLCKSVNVCRLFKQRAITEYDTAQGCLMISARLLIFLYSPNRKVQDSIGRCPEF